MRVLALDTSSTVAAVAMMEDTKLVGEYMINNKNTHSQKLMPMVKGLLDNLEIKVSDIDLFAVSIGPGSFTGLRIGITTVKAMAYALGKTAIGIPTLDSIANNVFVDKRLVCPIIDARNDQVYTAIYKFDGTLQTRVSEYMAVHISQLVEILKDREEEVFFLGDGVFAYADFFKAEMQDKCSFGTQDILMQRASTLAKLAIIKAKNGEVETAFSLMPFYLRQSQAERMRGN